MSTGKNIILGTLLLGGTAAAGTYFWMANTGSTSDLLQAVPHDTVMVMAMQGIPALLQDYHLLNDDYEPGFISKDVWEKMQAEMKEEGIEIDISSLLLEAKLNPAGVSAITFSADISADDPKDICFAYYLPSLSAEGSATYVQEFINTQAEKAQAPLRVTQDGKLFSIDDMSFMGHHDWVVFAYCEEGSSKAYLTSLSESTKSLDGEGSGELFSKMTTGDWQVAGIVDITTFHDKIDLLAQLEPELKGIAENLDIKSYETAGFRGYMGTGSMNMDLSLQFSSENAKPLKMVSKIDTQKMLQRLPGEPIMVMQQGFNIQEQLDLLKKSDPMVAEQIEESKAMISAMYGMDLEKDIVGKLGNQFGVALVDDDPLVGSHIWLELEKGHRFIDLVDKTLEQMPMQLNIDKKDGELFVQTPPEMLAMFIGFDLSVSLGITPEELVLSVGKQSVEDIKKKGENSIASKLNSDLKSIVRSGGYGSMVVDIQSARKIMDKPMVKEAMETEMDAQEKKTFFAFMNMLKNASVSADLDGRTVTTSLKVEGTSSTAFSDFSKDVLIEEIKKEVTF